MLVQCSSALFPDTDNPAKLIENIKGIAAGNNDSKLASSKSKESKRKKRILSVPLLMDSSNEEEIDLFPQRMLALAALIHSIRRSNTHPVEPPITKKLS